MRVLRYDLRRGVVPLERLGRQLATAALPAERRLSQLDPAHCTLLHGDAHVWNTLEDVNSADGRGFRFVDPEGLVGEPEYDLAILMREFSEELLAGDALGIGRARAAFLADHTHLQPQRIWEWGYLERVANALLTELDSPGSSPELLDIVDQWSRFNA